VPLLLAKEGQFDGAGSVEVLGRISWRACLTIALAGIAGLAGPAAAAERALPLLVTAPSADHPLPETTPGGTVILRGRSAGSSETGQHSAGSSANAAPPRAAPVTAWSRDYDTRVDKSGLDTTGFDGNFDRSGLHP